MSPTYRTETEYGFTLVELLVVIGIIAILTAIAVPMFLSQRTKAENAAVMSDLKNVAVNVMTEDLEPEEFFEKFQANTAYVEGDNATHNPAATEDKLWNSRSELDHIAVSKNTSISIVIASELSIAWTRPHEQGEFCLTGTSSASDYDYYTPGNNGHKNYNKILYYDSMLGGVKTADELAELYKGGAEVSCTAMVTRYIAATAPVPAP